VLELDHYLNALERKPRAVMHAAVVRQLPWVYARAKEMLCQDRHDGYREFCQILLLHREFAARDVETAIKTALAKKTLSLATVRQILVNHTALPTPRAVQVPKVLANYTVSAPDASRYDALLGVSV